jgi:hypothetical protein
VVHDSEAHVFCYVDADLRRDDQPAAILDFVNFWKQRTGYYPEELIFDSKLTTYARLNELNRLGIPFITLRRRSANPLLLAAGFEKTDVAIPWLKKRRLQIIFG